jgi:DENN (AEX-3) domain
MYGTYNHFTALVSRHPIYDLMRDYLTLSWARFSKDVQSHTLQISKILSHPAPRAGDVVRLDASAKDEANLEVVARFPGGLDFGRGLVDINFTMWPLFKCLNIDNILTICEVGVPLRLIIMCCLMVLFADCSCTYRPRCFLLPAPCHAWRM